jgi:hypothetical protein
VRSLRLSTAAGPRRTPGALLLGAVNRVLDLTTPSPSASRTAAIPSSSPAQWADLMTRILGIALGYEDLNDHDEPRRNTVMPAWAGKLAAGHSDCAPLAGKSTLSRLELSRGGTKPLCQDRRRHRRHRGAAGRSVSRPAARTSLATNSGLARSFRVGGLFRWLMTERSGAARRRPQDGTGTQLRALVDRVRDAGRTRVTSLKAKQSGPA